MPLMLEPHSMSGSSDRMEDTERQVAVREDSGALVATFLGNNQAVDPRSPTSVKLVVHHRLAGTNRYRVSFFS